MDEQRNRQPNHSLQLAAESVIVLMLVEVVTGYGFSDVDRQTPPQLNFFVMWRIYLTFRETKCL